jgi:signal transduction histidine kinase
MRQVLREGFDRRYVLFPLLAAITVVVTTFFVAEARRGYTSNLSESIRDGQDRLRDLAELIYASVGAESAQRGYLLTGDERYLEPDQEAQRTAGRLLDSLIARYTAIGSTEAATLSGVKTRLDIKFGELQKTVEQMREGKRRDALATVKTDVGLRYMREVLDQLEALRTRERAQVDERLADWSAGLRINTLINAALTAFTLILLVALGLLATREIRRRHAATAELERLVDQRTAELRDLSTHMVRIAELEKGSLARELHDELGGLLVAIRMDLAQLGRRIVLPDADAQTRWARVDAALAAGVALKRRVIEELRPTLLDNMGLMAAIRWQAEQSCEQGRLGLDLDVPEEEVTLPGDTAIAVFRSVQEALFNVLKHARAKRVKLSVQRGEGWLRVTVEDDGVGLPEGAAQRAGSHGLKQMRFRMQAVGGEMTAEAVKPHGTRSTLSLSI